MVLARLQAVRGGVRVVHGLNRSEVLATLRDVRAAEAWAEEHGYFFTTGGRRVRASRDAA